MTEFTFTVDNVMLAKAIMALIAGDEVNSKPAPLKSPVAPPSPVYDQELDDVDPMDDAFTPTVEQLSLIPHDARIHSSSEKRNADGTWKKRRNIDSAMVEQIERDYVRAMIANNITPAGVADAPAIVPDEPAAAPVATIVPDEPAAPAPVVAIVPDEPAAAPAPVVAIVPDAPTDFSQLMSKIAVHFANPDFQVSAGAIAQSMGVPTVYAFSGAPARIPEFYTKLVENKLIPA